MNKIISCAVAFILSTFLGSCQGTGNKTTERGKIETISPDLFEKGIHNTAGAQLLDVRTPSEFAGGHLKNALNLNYNDAGFEAEVGKLDKSKPVYVYCLSGGRSGRAASMLHDMGFTEVYNLDGGILKWQNAGKMLDHSSGTTEPSGLSLADFNKLVSGKNYVLADFNATWCVPCQKMLPIFQSIANQKKDVLSLVSIDADQNKALLRSKGIDNIPYLELYKDGVLVWKHEGAIEEKQFLEETKL